MRTHEDTRKDEEVFEDMFESVFWCSRCVRGSCSRGSRVDITAVQNYRRLINREQEHSCRGLSSCRK